MTGEPKKRNEHEARAGRVRIGNASTDRALSNELMRRHTFNCECKVCLF